MSLLTAREVSKRYGPVVALRSATLVVEPGEVHALLGANGAGKSTLVKVLTGVIRPDGGTILVNGAASSVSSPAQAARIGLAPVFQDPALVPRPDDLAEPAADGNPCRRGAPAPA
jgi:ribose transport system ATP-binding protein